MISATQFQVTFKDAEFRCPEFQFLQEKIALVPTFVANSLFM